MASRAWQAFCATPAVIPSAAFRSFIVPLNSGSCSPYLVSTESPLSVTWTSKLTQLRELADISEQAHPNDGQRLELHFRLRSEQITVPAISAELMRIEPASTGFVSM